MCHVLRHSELSSLMRERSENPYYITSESDCNKIFNAEVEADQFALDCLMENSESEEGNLIRFLGASLAHLTNFYLLDSPDIRGGKTHPDLDDRLKAVLKKVHFQEQANQIQFRMHILAGLQLYMHLTEASFLLEELQKFNFIEIEDFEKRFFELIGKMKNAARGKSD